MPRIPGTNRGYIGYMRQISDWNQFEKNKTAAAIWYWRYSSGAYPRLVEG